MLCGEHVDQIVLNDLNPGIAAFWRLLFNNSEHLLERVANARVTIEEWHGQRAIYRSQIGSDESLGWATFFLNRTNRSGILTAGPIGGLDQAGVWKLDVRFGRERLAKIIKRLAGYQNRVRIEQQDGAAFLAKELQAPRTFHYIDPPYLAQGRDLYFDALTDTAHSELARVLRSASDKLWMVSYDDNERVPRLYEGLRRMRFNIAHTAQRQYVGTEYGVFSNGLNLDVEALSADDPARPRRMPPEATSYAGLRGNPRFGVHNPATS